MNKVCVCSCVTPSMNFPLHIKYTFIYFLMFYLPVTDCGHFSILGISCILSIMPWNFTENKSWNRDPLLIRSFYHEMYVICITLFDAKDTFSKYPSKPFLSMVLKILKAARFPKVCPRVLPLRNFKASSPCSSLGMRFV